jgi:predicted ATPase
VDVESAGDAARLLETVALNLRVPQDPYRSLTTSLIEHLQERELLLILAHAQHFPGACAQLVETVLKTCPDVRMLVTGLQPLAVPGEKCYQGSGGVAA